jgi:hypothetical protein
MTPALVGTLMIAYYAIVGLVYLYKSGSGRGMSVSSGELLFSALITCPLFCVAIAYLTWWSR